MTNRLVNLLAVCHDGNLACIRTCYERERQRVAQEELNAGRDGTKLFFEVAHATSIWLRTYEVVPTEGLSGD